MIQHSANESGTGLRNRRLKRLQSRGLYLLSFWPLAIVGCFFISVRKPAVPAVASLVLLGLLVVTFHTVIAEWRIPGAKPKGRPGLGWVAVAASFVLGAPTYLASAIFAGFHTRRPLCAFPSPDGMPAYCAHLTTAEQVATDVWSATIASTVLLIIALGVLAHRSRVAASMPLPVMVTGGVMAVDFAHCAYLLTT